MTEQLIMAQYFSSHEKSRKRRELAVNALRHLAMDAIAFDVTDDFIYMLHYVTAMTRISSEYLFLSLEVQRQMAKKYRRQVRRTLEKRQESVHI